jgi:hypothetical protein
MTPYQWQQFGIEQNLLPPKQIMLIEKSSSELPQAETLADAGTGGQGDKTPIKSKDDGKTQRTRKTNLSRAIDAAVKSMGKKPSLDELWKYFEDDKDETKFILDNTNTHITWIDTKGKLHDTQKESIANQLSRIKS